MKKSLFYLFFFLPIIAQGQYYPRGTNLNDNYLPNLEEPDKWIISVDGGFDFQREKQGDTLTSYQTTHANFNLFYGGETFRGGAQVIHDFNRDVKDLSVGLGVGFYRPVFVELGVGYLNRILPTTSFEGWSYSAKLGYQVNWVMKMQYRMRLRMAIMVNQKNINATPDQQVLQFYPVLGLEFET